MPSIISATTTNGLSTSADNSGSLQLATNNGTTALTIDTSQRVLIGATSASGFDTGADDLVVGGGSGSTGMTIYSGTTGVGGINFADGNTGSAIYAGGMNYNHSTNRLSFYTNDGTGQMAVTSAGLFQFNSGYGSVATAYGCRAWVNFNGVSGVTIRGSGNISSVTRVSAGKYDVNFTTAMPDANYSPIAFLNGEGGTGEGNFRAVGLWGLNTLTTGSFRVEYYGSNYVDSALVFVAVFR